MRSSGLIELDAVLAVARHRGFRAAATELGMSRSALIVHGAEPVSAETQQAYGDLIARRAQGAPVAYLTGRREFWSLDLDVTPDLGCHNPVLIP